MGILFVTHTIKFMEYKKDSEVIIDVNTKEVNKVIRHARSLLFYS
jgi:hypothetical protein